MAYHYYEFYRESKGYNAEDGDKLDFILDYDGTDSVSGVVATTFRVIVDGMITSATDNARYHDFDIKVKSNEKN